MIRNIQICVLVAWLVVIGVGCPTVHKRDDHTIKGLEDLGQSAKDLKKIVVKVATDKLEKELVTVIADAFDAHVIEIDSLLTYEKAKKDALEAQPQTQPAPEDKSTKVEDK